MNGGSKCYMHGGASLKGVASATYKTGRYSKFLPEGLFAIHEQVANDPDMLSVRQEINLIDALIAAKLPILETGESAQHWELAIKFVSKARVAYKSERYGDLEESLHELEALADNRRLFYATEQEVTAQIEQRRKLVETEQKILYNQEKSITAEQALLLVSALLDSIRRNVKDASTLNTIQTDFVQVIGATNQRQLIDANND